MTIQLNLGHMRIYRIGALAFSFSWTGAQVQVSAACLDLEDSILWLARMMQCTWMSADLPLHGTGTRPYGS